MILRAREAKNGARSLHWCRSDIENGAAMLKIFRPFGLGAFCLLMVLIVVGCGPKSQYVIMPDPNGNVGRIEVITQKGSRILDQPWQSTEVTSVDRMPGEPKVLDETKVREMFKDALDARPGIPIGYMIYFKTGDAGITADSQKTMQEIVEAIRTRQSTEICVCGHTDSVGSIESNRTLSMNRAQTVADFLVFLGVKKENIEITYHGKERPLVRVPDGVAEPRNRRVEITIR